MPPVLQVPEGLSDAERAQLYVSGGQAVQQAAVIDNLPGLLRSAGRGVFPAISRSLMEAARQLDSEGQMAAAESFATVARERLLPNVDLADAILPLVLAGVGDGGHPAAQAAWLACLADIAPALDPITLRNRVLPSVVARGSGGGRSLRERCLCCLLLGAVAPYADEEDLKRTLLRLAGTLCQDTEWQVRHAACQQLPALATATADKLPAAELEGVLEDLFGLLEDEEVGLGWLAGCAYIAPEAPHCSAVHFVHVWQMRLGNCAAGVQSQPDCKVPSNFSWQHTSKLLQPALRRPAGSGARGGVARAGGGPGPAAHAAAAVPRAAAAAAAVPRPGAPRRGAPQPDGGAGGPHGSPGG